MGAWRDGRSCFIDIRYKLVLNWAYFIDCLHFILFCKMLYLIP